MDATRRSDRLQDKIVRPTDPPPSPQPSFISGSNWKASELHMLNVRFAVADAVPELSVLNTYEPQWDAELKTSSSWSYTSSNVQK
jgi:hypothetical protein